MPDKRVRVITFLLSASTALGIGIGFSLSSAATADTGSWTRYVFGFVCVLFATISAWLILIMRHIIGETK